ncbi:hypothetical protein MAPG_01964 [Magnaporthiopsis poae ATCC 64411]|uniref:Glucuronan lyase A n=1 Tax=Magnaporthiopsis poae (strain ATCC 64411 / 73-15) TaxID=644358 RepID=A0A0C4DQ27_MAGP6|nr:hypothetical protein MAPG_01964 [Magnaporthiopsis poae ATCC 64411]
MGPQTTLKTLAVLALSLLSPTASASRSFENRGTLDGWHGQSIDSGTRGSVQQVTNVFLKGPTALKASQTYLGTSYKGRYHAEVYRRDGYRPGETRYYGFAFRLSEDWEFTDQNYNIAQFIADFSDLGKPECDTWMPSTMVWVRGNKLRTRARWGDLSGNKCDKQTDSWDVATIERGRWHRVVLGVSWRTDGKGFVKVWLDGEQKLDKQSISTTVVDPANRQFSFRVGLYANGWHDDKGVMKGSQPFRQVWYDEIAIGSSEGEVQPGSW